MTSRSERTAARRVGAWFASAPWTLRLGFVLCLGLAAKGLADLGEAGLLWFVMGVAIFAGALAGRSGARPRSDGA